MERPDPNVSYCSYEGRCPRWPICQKRFFRGWRQACAWADRFEAVEPTDRPFGQAPAATRAALPLPGTGPLPSLPPMPAVRTPTAPRAPEPPAAVPQDPGSPASAAPASWRLPACIVRLRLPWRPDATILWEQDEAGRSRYFIPLEQGRKFVLSPALLESSRAEGWSLNEPVVM